MAVERTFIAVKPDGVERGLVGQIIHRFEARGLKLVGLKILNVSGKQAEEHYGEHKGKPFFDGLVKHITSGPIVAMVWEGKNVVAISRSTIGATNPVDSTPGSIRGDLAMDIGRNIVHGSDSPTNAEREIKIYFSDADLLPSYQKAVDKWVCE